MNDDLAQRWREYRGAIEDVYLREDGTVVEFDTGASDEALDEIADRSDELSGMLAELLGDRPPKSRTFPLDPGQSEPPSGADDRERGELELAAFALAGIDPCRRGRCPAELPRGGRR
jgi:hypothetical protein